MIIRQDMKLNNQHSRSFSLLMSPLHIEEADLKFLLGSAVSSI